MIKAGGTYEGDPLLILGLSAENYTRMLAGEPILLETGELGLPSMRVLLIGGRTEEAIAATLREHLGRYPGADTRPGIACTATDR